MDIGDRDRLIGFILSISIQAYEIKDLEELTDKELKKQAKVCISNL